MKPQKGVSVGNTGMTYKEFKAWCNDRACDGMWGMRNALICVDVIETVNSKPLWKREKEWRKAKEDCNIEKMVNAINEKIMEVTSDGK